MYIEDKLSFLLNDESKKLLAVFVPYDNQAKVTASIIQQQLTEKDFSHLFIPENRISQLIRLCNDATEPFQFEIGELKDASCEISVSSDGLTATLIATSHFGGRTLTLVDIHNALQQAKIVYGVISDQEIEIMLERLELEKYINFVIANGFSQIDGTDTKFESLIPDAIEKFHDNPYGEEQDTVDFRECCSIVIIQEGQPVMRRIPATQGLEGYDVFGKVLTAYHGVDLPFSTNQQGVCIDPNNNELLLSTLIGTANLIPCGVIVLPVLTVESVSLETGNINFAGTVMVQGDIENGMTIYAMNDLIIEGNVENAHLECGGTLVVRGNMQNSNVKADGNVCLHGGMNASKVISHASVNVLFSEYSNVEAGLDITVCDYSLNSGLFASNKIVVGQKGAKRKSLVGGITWAMLEIKAAVLGINTEVITDIRVGSDPHVQRRINELNELIAENDKEQGYIKKLIAHLSSKATLSTESTNLNERLNLNLHKLISERGSYDKEFLKLYENMAMMEYARIQADRLVHVGCNIQISGITYKTKETLKQSVFRNKQGKITVTNKLSALIKNR